MATVQTDRVLRLTTPLGPDFLLVEGFTVTEGLSQLYSIKADLLHAESTPEGTVPTIIDPAQILGQPMCIEVEQPDEDTTRFFHGIVNRFSQGVRDGMYTVYDVEIVPRVWVLTQKQQSRIFQQKSIPEILRKVLEGIDVQWELKSTYEPRNYCVQYRESDFDFASRLMEEEGIYYYFFHEAGKHTMLIGDTPGSHREVSPLEIPFVLEVEGEANKNAIVAWDMDHAFQSGKVTYWDHNFEMHNKKLEASKNTLYTHGNNDRLEIYDYPGGYARKFDGIDPGGGERPGDITKIFSENKKTAEITMQGIDSRFTIVSAEGTSAAISAGSRFKLINHPAASGEYVITGVSHTVTQSPSYRSEAATDTPFTNKFTCIPYGKIPTTNKPAPPFRPERVTPKPFVRGSQTAIVVGPPGEEIFTDKYGRVKVQFHWDRHGKYDADSSCWLRVAQGWAGHNWGTMFIPRVDMEVVVSFLEGDPDQPIITGCVYNAASMPPYKLPDEKTKSTIKSHSTIGGGGFNEFRFEDKKGAEQIFIHAEHNQDIYVKNDCMEHVVNNRHLTVENDQLEEIMHDKSVKVAGDHNEQIGGNTSLSVGMDLQEKVGKNYAVESGMSVHVKAGMTAVIEAGVKLTLKVGGNFIDINPAGVFIQGAMVMINSGGAAGSGVGCNPKSPEAPAAADKANPGQKLKKPKAPPKPPSSKLGELAKLAVKASKRPKSAGKMSPEDARRAVEVAQQVLATMRRSQEERTVDAAKDATVQAARMVVAAVDALPFI